MLSVSWGLAWASFTHPPGQHCGEHQQTCLLLDMHVRFGLVEWRCDSCSIAAEHRNVNTQCHFVPKGSALYSLQDCALTSRSQTTLGICKPLVLKKWPVRNKTMFSLYSSVWRMRIFYCLRWDCISNCPFRVPVHFFLWCLPHWFLGSLNDSYILCTDNLDSLLLSP